MTHLPSVSIVVITEDGTGLQESLDRAIAVLDPDFMDIETVLVANGVTNEAALDLKKVAMALPDLTCHFVADKVEPEAARLIGMEHAIGDYVLLTDATSAELQHVPAMVQAIREGFDLVVVPDDSLPDPQPFAYRAARRAYHRVINAVSGVEILDNPPTLRLLSRPAAVYLLGQINAEVLLRAASLGTSFPAKTLRPGYRRSSRERRRLGTSVGRGIRSLVLTSSLPLRAAVFAGCLGAAASILYSCYAIATYLLRSGVQPGWTTLSLTISGMMFLLFVILALMAEYVLQIHSRMPFQRRYHVTRELRSPLTRHEHRRNVIVATGEEIEVGLPADLIGERRDG